MWENEMADKPRKQIKNSDKRRFPALFRVGAMAMAWALAFSAFSSFLHEVFRSTSLDMALHSQILWNLAHGRFMETSLLPHSFAANHFWPGFYLLVPVYQLFGVHGILALQCLTVASGAFAAFWLSRDITKSDAWSLALALAYLLQPTLSAGVLFDCHLELFSVPFALFALLGLRRNRPWFWLCLLVSVAFYEIVAVVFFFLGLGLLLVRGRRRTGGLIALFCLMYLGMVFFVAMPHSGGGTIPHWGRYSHLGRNFAEATANVLLHPLRSLSGGVTLREVAKLRYLFLAFGLLPLFSLKHLLPALPLVFVLLLSNVGINADIRYGYMAPVLPFLFLSAAHGVAKLKRAGWLDPWRFNRYGPYVLVACSVLVCGYFQVKRPLRRAPFRVRSNLVELRAVRGLVPKDAGLSADNHLGPHFADRALLLVTPSTKRGGTAVDYVLADLREMEFKDSRWWEDMKTMLLDGEYGPVYFSNDVLLLQRGHENEPLARQALERIGARQQAVRQRH
jgi:uncharacterized membrane protein